MQEYLFKSFYVNNVPLMKEHLVIRLVLSSIAYVPLSKRTLIVIFRWQGSTHFCFDHEEMQRHASVWVVAFQ